MPVYTHRKIGFVQFLLAVMLFAASCNIGESYENCPPDEPTPPPGVDEDIRQLLYVRVTDELIRNDISDSQELDDIMVYLFDRNEKLVDTIPYTQNMIRQGIPMNLTDRELAGGFVTVWANLGNSVESSPVAMGADIDDLNLSMLANDSRADFYLCPGDMFFGNKQMAFIPVDELTEADTVWIRRKNSRLQITVRGLTDIQDAAEYYFRIGSIYSGYNFEGASLLESRNIWEEGIFDSEDDYISPEPYIMIHNASDHVYSEQSRVLIELFKVGPARTDTLIASGDRDVNDNYILLEQGKTTNVLIAIDGPTGDITVQTVITPWEEIHQWVKW